MAFLQRWLLIFSALILGGGQLYAASREQRAYAAAVSAFQDELWSRAETSLGQFVKKYPDSTNAPSAILLLAQAEFKQGEFSNAIVTLNSHADNAGSLTDQYVYWTAEAQFAAGDFSAAAGTFASVARNFPQSPLRLTSAVEAAAAAAKIPDWPRVAGILSDTNGIFHLTEKLDPANELVSRGRLLLAQAKFDAKDFPGAQAVLDLLVAQPLPPPVDWQRAHLLYQVRLAVNDLPSALAVTTNLLLVAQSEKNAAHSAESVALQAGLLEKLQRAGDALAVYQLNLAGAAPPEYQRQAVLKIAALAIAEKQFPFAETNLENFLAQNTDAAGADVLLLTLGELHLQDFLAQPAATNQLAVAQARFDQFLVQFTNSPLAGKVFLDRGWCNWLAGKISESRADFQNAAQRLPASEDLAVAKFKSGDALFTLGDFSGARTNYQSVLDDFQNLPSVKKELAGRALYQIVRASLELKDDAGADAALKKLLGGQSLDEFAQGSALLFGESTIDPAAARAVFQKLEAQFPQSPLRAQVDLAVARTFEQEQNWPAAVTNYEGWLKNYPTNSLLPQASYALAWAKFQAGDETNAFDLFGKFVAQFPGDAALAPLAQWWVADHYFRAGDFVNAEKNYQNVFQNWPASGLADPAQLMAGRAAFARLGYSDAIRHYASLLADTNAPDDLKMQARFAYGAVLMQMPSTDTNNPFANLQAATNMFGQITNEARVRAWGEIADCALQMGDYASATNFYAQVSGPNSTADVSLRSQAQIGFGLALEKMAAQASGADQTNLLALARDTYLDVFYGTNLRKDETLQDAFWTKKAGLQALPLIVSPGATNVDKFFDHLEALFPQAKASLEKRRAALSPAKS